MNHVKDLVDRIDKKASYAVFRSWDKLFPKTKPFLHGLEWSCNGLLWLSVTIILLLCNQEASSIYAKLLIGLIMDVFYVAITKSLARRRRPPYNQRDQFIVASVDKHSMPSGHCSRATYLSYFIAHFFHASAPLLTILFTIWGICVCASRVLLGRHHILDCAVGILLGWLEYQIQFNTFIPINSIGLYLVGTMVRFVQTDTES